MNLLFNDGRATCLLLLDEWDANLDDSNIRLLDKEIQILSLSMIIVEVRHLNQQLLNFEDDELKCIV